MRGAQRAPAGLHPAVRFVPGFEQRLEHLSLLVQAARVRREGAGSGVLEGEGEEFIGYRPYRAGEDLRPIDWNLFARLDRPYVRVTRREASESWVILLDTSASMAVGPPGKLQAAAELCAALATIGLREGARVALRVSGQVGVAEEIGLRNRRDLYELLAFLQGLQARGAEGLAHLLQSFRPAADSGRVFVLGDLLDLEPGALAVLQRRGRELFVVQLLAPHELRPPESGAVEWIDPESGATFACELDAGLATAYGRKLELLLEGWRDRCVRHGLRYLCTPSDEDFERVLPRLLRWAV